MLVQVLGYLLAAGDVALALFVYWRLCVYATKSDGMEMGEAIVLGLVHVAFVLVIGSFAVYGLQRKHIDFIEIFTGVAGVAYAALSIIIIVRSYRDPCA
ncbi:MAG: hypothetical protein AB199_03825 [Parcubacteria bacterium C7867-004]|nr:MAG: hypothetical protein AB199_03825 [Parcubacteria bacterium C7867-004]